MGRNPTFSLGMLKLPNIWDFSAVGSAGRVEGAEGGCLQLSPCLPPSDVKGVSEECLPPAPGTGGAEIPPPEHQQAQQKGLFSRVTKLGTEKWLFIYLVCVGAFLAFLGDVLFPPPPPQTPSSLLLLMLLPCTPRLINYSG